MFDQAPQNLPTEPEDILAPAENEPATSATEHLPEASSTGVTEAGPTALAAGRLRPATSSHQGQGGNSQIADQPEREEMESDIQISPPILNKRNLFIIAVSFLVLLIIAGAFWVSRSSSKRRAESTSNTVAQVKEETQVETSVSVPVGELTSPTPDSIVSTATSSPVVQPLPLPSSIDSDSDGLTDAQEIQYGTDPQKADTDGDGLTDYEEIFIWHTNPLNPDTDGDGFSDGMEVKNGYNPNGSGKLLNIPSDTSSLQPTGTQ